MYEALIYYKDGGQTHIAACEDATFGEHFTQFEYRDNDKDKLLIINNIAIFQVVLTLLEEKKGCT